MSRTIRLWRRPDGQCVEIIPITTVGSWLPWYFEVAPTARPKTILGPLAPVAEAEQWAQHHPRPDGYCVTKRR